MSGHSKWHNIKRKKGIEDAKRGKLFTKMARLISVAAKKGGEDPSMNPSLRLAIEKAKQARLPKENIKRAIKRGVGSSDADNFEEVVYEGYGPKGVAFMLFALTDNKNRTVAEVKNIFSKFEGSLGQPGCVSYLFDATTKKPTYEVDVSDEGVKEKIMTLVDQFEDNDDIYEVISNYNFI